jgi:hypothetical protein
MSIMISADLLGSSVMGEVVVEMVSLGVDGVLLVADGRERSNPVRFECSQKFDLVPMCALR